MSIVASDIEIRLAGGAANTNPNASLGGAMGTAAGAIVASGAANAVFDDVSSAEASAGDVEYRGLYVKNNHATLTWLAVGVYIDQLTTSADTEIDIALAAEATGTPMATIANESTAPVGVTFTRPTTVGGALVIGDIPAGGAPYKGIWVRRTVTAGAAAAAADTASIRFQGDTL